MGIDTVFNRWWSAIGYSNAKNKQTNKLENRKTSPLTSYTAQNVTEKKKVTL